MFTHFVKQREKTQLESELDHFHSDNNKNEHLPSIFIENKSLEPIYQRKCTKPN